MATNDYQTTGNASIWIQERGPGTAMAQLSCYAIATISSPKGDVTPDWCFDNTVPGKRVLIGTRQAAPGLVTLTLEGLTRRQADYLDKAMRRSCPISIYVAYHACAPKSSFLGFDMVKVIQNATNTTHDENTVAARDASTDEQVLQSWAFAAEAEERAYKADLYRLTVAEVEISHGMAACGIPSCGGYCGSLTDPCDKAWVGQGDVAAGIANIIELDRDTDGVWTETAHTGPFIASEDIVAVTCFPIDKDTTRVLVGCGTTKAGAPAEISYTDDEAVTWHDVSMGLPNAAFFLTGNSIFALDRYHIWGVTDLGDCWFSDDGGASWTQQAFVNAVPLRAVHFCDKDNGVIVGGATGASVTVWYTNDGGETWIAAPDQSPAAATVMANCVLVQDSRNWFVGLENGTLYRTTDGGATWTNQPIWIPAGQTASAGINAIRAIDRYCIWLVTSSTHTATIYGTVQRTVNGGKDWEGWLTPALTAVGLFGLGPCSYNEALVSGGVGVAAATTYVGQVKD